MPIHLSALLLPTVIFCNVIAVAFGQLLRDRTVQCSSSEMRVQLQFAQPFSGVVYASKYFQANECRWDGDSSSRLQFSVPLNANANQKPYCGVQLKDNSGEFAVTLVVSPLRNLLIDGMEGLTVRCLYSIGDVTLTLPAGQNGAGIFISPQTQAGVVTGSGGAPFLQMVVRDGHGISGEVIQSAQVGQRITLDVVMQDTTIYDFWVHDCYAHDGTNTAEASVAIIDQKGCAVRLARAVDAPVFATNPAPHAAKHIYVNMYGFQFTTSQLVYFECQVRPCLQTCNRPQCNESASSNATGKRRKREVQRLVSNSTLLEHFGAPADNYNLTAVIRIEPASATVLHAARDAPDANEDDGSLSLNQVGSVQQDVHKGHLCVQWGVAIAILAVFAVVCVTSLLVVCLLCHRARRPTKLLLSKASSHATALYSNRGALSSSASPTLPSWSSSSTLCTPQL